MSSGFFCKECAKSSCSHSNLSANIQTYHNSKFQRNHLLTKQDLKNIKNGLRTQMDSDAENLDKWLLEMDVSCYIPIYKPKNEISTQFPFLKEDDFVLVFINKWQLHVLMTYENNFICIDGIQGLNSSGLQLHTLSVLNDSKEGFPCAFLISNRIDEQILSLFYSGVREVCVCKIKTKMFMSNVENMYYDAWVQVMFPPENRFFCSWHVDEDWIRNLNKINSAEKQINVYGELRILLCETDKKKFAIMIQQFVQSFLGDEATADFGRYFQANYFHRASFWAHCHRLDTGIDESAHLERMHRTMKYLFLHDETIKRFDTFLSVILTFVKDKLFDPTIASDPLILWSKTTSVKNGHEASRTLDLSSVLVTEWGGFEIYEMNQIHAIQKNNTLCNCNLICTDCEVCLHAYSCTCIEYAIRWKMCKHIHLAILYKKTYPKLCAKVEEKHSKDDSADESEIPAITDNIRKKTEDTTLQAKIDDMKILFDDAIKKITSHRLCDAMAKMLAPIHPTLDTIKMLE